MKTKIAIFSIKLWIAVCVFLIDAFGQINENKSQGPPEPILHDSVVSHFDQPLAMGIDDLNEFKPLTNNQ